MADIFKISGFGKKFFIIPDNLLDILPNFQKNSKWRFVKNKNI
jgi:hypothetical protein